MRGEALATFLAIRLFYPFKQQIIEDFLERNSVSWNRWSTFAVNTAKWLKNGTRNLYLDVDTFNRQVEKYLKLYGSFSLKDVNRLKTPDVFSIVLATALLPDVLSKKISEQIDFKYLITLFENKVLMEVKHEIDLAFWEDVKTITLYKNGKTENEKVSQIYYGDVGRFSEKFNDVYALTLKILKSPVNFFVLSSLTLKYDQHFDSFVNDVSFVETNVYTLKLVNINNIKKTLIYEGENIEKFIKENPHIVVQNPVTAVFGRLIAEYAPELKGLFPEVFEKVDKACAIQKPLPKLKRNTKRKRTIL